MSLIEQNLESCTMIDKVTVPDGYGGFITEYVDGASFESAITLDLSTTARIGQKQGVNNVYSVFTSKNATLQSYDIFRRESDGKTFRVTSDGLDNKTPNGAMLNLRKVSAEEWTLPS
jgi:hypothetical protein